jgi:hypothetical protein
MLPYYCLLLVFKVVSFLYPTLHMAEVYGLISIDITTKRQRTTAEGEDFILLCSSASAISSECGWKMEARFLMEDGSKILDGSIDADEKMSCVERASVGKLRRKVFFGRFRGRASDRELASLQILKRIK